MKILFLSSIPSVYEHVSDYQSDMLFHGLRTVLGENVVDANKMWHMYNNIDMSQKHKIWGKGFTLYGLLPDIEVDRNNLDEKINHGFFDYCIFTLHHTVVGTPYAEQCVNEIRKFFPKERTIVVDGHDRVSYNHNIANNSVYFKRELENDDVLPIHFAIPEESIRKIYSPKTYAFAPLVPVNHSWNSEHIQSYIYNDEEIYYQDYQKSWFAYTCKKGGWDCLRHYEILAAGCMPWFTDIEICPKNTLYRFPKELCIRAKKIKGCVPGTTVEYNPQVETYLGTTEKIKLREERGYLADNFDFGEYYEILEDMRYVLRNKLTTKALAEYVLNRIEEENENR